MLYVLFYHDILCGLCSHSSGRAAEMLQKLLRGPCGPLLGATWTETTPLVMLPNISIDGQDTCWTVFPKEDPHPKQGQSQNSIRLGLVVRGCVGRTTSHVVKVIRLWAVWAWIIEGLVIMMMVEHLNALLLLAVEKDAAIQLVWVFWKWSRSWTNQCWFPFLILSRNTTH